MIARLTDPWFEAEFYRVVGNDGLAMDASIPFGQAHGLGLWCPCGYGKAEFPLDGARPHYLIIPFADRGVPDSHGPTSRDGQRHPRWQIVGGTSLADLSLAPSIDVGTDSCWHGFITNGEVR